jgi:hypothetical protein
MPAAGSCFETRVNGRTRPPQRGRRERGQNFIGFERMREISIGEALCQGMTSVMPIREIKSIGL